MTLEAHTDQTKEQVLRLEQAFALFDLEPQKLKSEAVRSLIKDAEWTTKHIKTPEARDAALIAAAQYFEHHEMAGYFSAVSWAELLGEQEVASPLSKNLSEEKMTDRELTELAVTTINAGATSESQRRTEK